MSKLIPKHQTPSQPLVLSQDNTRVESPYVESIPITETNLYKQYLADPYKNSDFNTWKKRQELIQSNRKDEKVTADNRPSKVKKQESKQGEAIYNYQQRKEQEAKNNKLIWTGIGLGGLALAQATPAAPWLDAAFATHGALRLAKQYEEGTLGWNGETALNTLQVLPFGVKGVRKIQPVVSDGYKAAKNWAKAKIISSKLNKPISQEALNQVNEIFRTSEWNEFLMSKNGYNYYRINTPKAKGDEMIFLSHTTPWGEFIPKPDISVPAYAELGPKLLYEFPHKTFGTLKASGCKPGSFGDVDVRRYGLQHLLYGKYASGKRGLVRNMSSKNYMRAKQAGLDVDEFIFGLEKRPLVNGHYDHNPIYEDIHNGYQTQIKADDFFTAIKTKPHMTYEYTDNGIQKILWNP